MMRPTRRGGRFCTAAMAAMLVLGTVLPLQAQSDSPPPSTGSRGENFSNKPAPQLFNADCTGAGCHKSPQGLAKSQNQMSLAAFLREHYTNSRESAAALAAYIMKVPAAPAPPEPRAAARAGTARPPAEVPGASWFDPVEPGDPRQLRQPPQQGGKPARAAARSGEPKPSEVKPGEAKPADAKPTEAKPAEAKPAESKPESKPESRP